MKRFGCVVALLFMLAAHVFLLQSTATGRRSFAAEEHRGGGGLSGKVLKVLSLEFDGVMADWYFLRGLVFVGSTFELVEDAKVRKVAKHEWEWLYDQLNIATDLDPAFLDPYYVGETFLAWDAREVHLANRLLEKACLARNNDWMPPFFLGFNYFYFLSDQKRAAPYLMTASRLPGASVLVRSLASRAAYEGGETDVAIVFLQEMLSQAEDGNSQRVLAGRLKDLLVIKEIELAVGKYFDREKKYPRDIDELLASGDLSQRPQDPHGGTFYLTFDGKVRTTSELK